MSAKERQHEATLKTLNMVKSHDEDQKLLKSKRRVRKEILAVTKEYNHENSPPPFSAAEMVVMAVVCGEEKYLRIDDIILWITKHFKYYRAKALEEYALAVKFEGNYEEVDMVIPGICEAFDFWEAPLEDALEVRSMSRRHHDLTTIEVNPSRARIFLRRWLEPEREGTFPFLRLPAELRNTIYEMVFSFPKSGFYIHNSNSSGHGVTLLERDMEDLEGSASWPLWTEEDEILESDPMQIVLALLSVNKQVYSEAMPYFYRTNFFFFEDLKAFVTFTKKVSCERVKHLGHLYLVCGWQSLGQSPNMVKDFIAATRALVQAKSLRKLEIALSNDYDWKDLPLHVRQQLGLYRKLTKPEQIPGIFSLVIAASNARAFEIHGSSPLVEEYMRITSSAIRTRAGVPDEEEEPKKRRKRTKKATKESASDHEDEEKLPVKKRAKTGK